MKYPVTSFGPGHHKITRRGRKHDKVRVDITDALDKAANELECVWTECRGIRQALEDLKGENVEQSKK